MESLSQYHIFYTVAKNGSISAAANELFISQPAVSKSIKKLEELLQTTLFIRGRRGVKCTEDGRILYEHLASAFSSIQEGEQMLQRNRAFEVGQIHLAPVPLCVSTLCCRFFRHLLKKIRISASRLTAFLPGKLHCSLPPIRWTSDCW